MSNQNNRPGTNHRGDVNDLLGSGVGTEHISRQFRRRRAASWRLPPMPSGDRRDPWCDRHDEWSPRELDSLTAAAQHLSALGLYGRWQSPEPARRAWSCQRCPCQRGEVA